MVGRVVRVRCCLVRCLVRCRVGAVVVWDLFASGVGCGIGRDGGEVGVSVVVPAVAGEELSDGAKSGCDVVDGCRCSAHVAVADELLEGVAGVAVDGVRAE